MMEKLSSAVTRPERIMPRGVYRIFCGAYQLYLAVNSAYECMAGTFQDPLYDIICYVRQQEKMNAEMGTDYPTESAITKMSF